MSIQRRPKTGKDAQGRVRWIVRYRSPDGHEHSRTFDNQKTAKQFDADQATRISTGGWIDPEQQKITVAQLVDEWRVQARRPSTEDNRKQLADNLGSLADTPVGKVTRPQVTEWATQLREGRPWADGRPLASSTVDNYVRNLRSVLGRAVEDGLLPRNPAAHLKYLKPPAKEQELSESSMPTTEEVRALLRVAEHGGTFPNPSREAGVQRVEPCSWMHLAMRISVETGLRPGEVAGLDGEDIDTTRLVIHVRQQAQRTLQSGRHRELKTLSSPRVVPMTPDLARVLHGAIPGRPVVAGGTGFGTTATIISNSFGKFRDAAGARGSVSFHGFRHFYASSLLAAGESPVTVARMLGHSSMSTTARVYAHWMPESLDATRELVAAVAGSLRDERPTLRVVNGCDQRKQG